VGAEVKPEDTARLSPRGKEHINVPGRYSFALADGIAEGERRPLHQRERFSLG
jgi:hypothetical protein